MDERVRILLVDDEANVLRSLERTFLDDDYEILTASSGVRGLAVLEEVSPIQVVISDYRMPEMNGIEFLREVCRRWPDTVRIVLSGYADTGVVISAINEGEIYKFIPKPWNDDELQVAVINALERYSLNKKNIELTEALFAKMDELNRVSAELTRLSGRIGIDPVVSEEILQALPVGVIVLDGTGIIIRCNDEAGRLISRDAATCVGVPCHQALPAEAMEFISGAAGRQRYSGSFSVGGVAMRVAAQIMHSSGQVVTTLILDREECRS